MAKPILIVKADTPYDLRASLAKKLTDKFSDYHVLIINHESFEPPTFECLNDCKGLLDIDIEKLIKDFNAI